MEKRLIGYITVDSGAVMVADPCYWVDDDEVALNEDETKWGRFCKEIGKENVHSFNHRNGVYGKGVLINGFGGDGLYRVYAVYDETGRQTQLIVDFN